MARIEGIRIRNFRVLRDITLGKLWNTPAAQPLAPLTAVIGKNGVGKSSLFDAFGFLADCLKQEACDVRGRGGFDRIRSQGSETPRVRGPGRIRKLGEFAIDKDHFSRPYVSRERLRQRRRGQTRGRPFSFLMMNGGKGVAWSGDAPGLPPQNDEFSSLDWEAFFRLMGDVESTEREIVELQDTRKLGIATLGALKQHPRIAAFRQFIEGWYLSYFTPDAARGLPMAGPQRHLSVHGDNLGNVVQFMEREHRDRFERILQRIAARVPGIAH